MTNLIVYKTPISEFMRHIRNIYINARQGLNSDRSIINAIESWLIRSSDISVGMDDTYVDIAFQGLRYRPVSVSIVTLSFLYAIGSSLDLCRGVSEENKNLDTIGGTEWVLTVLSLAGASLSSSASDVPTPRLLRFMIGAGFISFFISLTHYCVVLAFTDIVGTISVFFAVSIVSLFVWMFFLAIIYSLVGAPVAYLYTICRALGALFKR